ncbi:QCR6 [Candida jiufengensis]|uniref:QCR6 n=1 Tax=Candida jiufengensis TaxID=497108 RepID=UPI002224D571|nr:QCR6 [Candida jiufengensis]KAI5953500.1 QCR6 [Candida jiufengensis]
MSFLRDIFETIIPSAYADEPADETQNEVADQEAPEAEEEASPEEEVEEEKVDPEEDGDDDEEEDDEDEDEAELEDPLDKLREECVKTSTCKPFDHHFHECVERVTKEMQEPGYEHKHYKEDCVEEFFHLEHCVNDCVAPRLFSKLK